MTPPSTVGPARAIFRAIVRAVVPAAESMDAAAWARAEGIVDEALADRPASVRRQIVLFMRLVNWVALPRYGRTFTRLDADRARRFLSSFERSPLLLLRRGLWGVRTFAYMGYYTQDAVQREVGYAAAKEGWDVAEHGPVAWLDRDGAGQPEETTLTVEDGQPHA